MENFGLYPATLILIGANVLASVTAFLRPSFMEQNLFHVGPILRGGEYHRLLTSGFLHGGVMHLFVNMYVLFNFGSVLEQYALATWQFVFVYFAALIGGNLWALMENRRKLDYRALGASGATSGIVLSFTLFSPFQELMIFPIPIPMPAIVLAILFIVASAILAQRPNKVIGHEAHLGGALAGILATLLVAPSTLGRFSSQIAAFLGGG